MELIPLLPNKILRQVVSQLKSTIQGSKFASTIFYRNDDSKPWYIHTSQYGYTLESLGMGNVGCGSFGIFYG
jgi:hypothetical protein